MGSVSQQPPQTAAPARRAAWFSGERANTGLLVALLFLLEILPVEAWLLALATAGSSDSPVQAIGPFWLLCAGILGFALIRHTLGPYGVGAVAPVALLFGLLMLALLVRFSPSAYGAFPGGWGSGSWWGQFIRDAVYDTQRFNGLFALVLLVAYLGWRGLALGGRLPSADQARRRFVLSVSALTVAMLLAVVAPSAYQGILGADLVTLLALGAFAGLGSSSLIRWREAAGESAVRQTGDERRWLATGLGLAGLIAVVALVLGLSLNLAAVLDAVRTFGPVGAAVSAAIEWLLQMFAYLLWLLFVRWLPKGKGGIISNPPPLKTPSQNPHAPHQLGVPPIVDALAGVLVGLFVVAMIVILVVIGLRAMLRTPESLDDEVDEDREDLDGRRLLEAQVRDLFRRRGRRQGEADDLPVGASVRRLYRETLRAAARVGLGRRPNETPDEFAPRVAASLTQRGVSPEEAQVGALTAAYDDTRYGERNPDAPASAEVAAEARRVTKALRRLAEQSGNRP